MEDLWAEYFRIVISLENSIPGIYIFMPIAKWDALCTVMKQNLNFRPEIEMIEPRYLAGGLILNGTTFWIIGGIGTSKEFIDDCFDSDDEDNDLLASGSGSGCNPLEMFDHQYILKTSEFITLDNPSVKGKSKT